MDERKMARKILSLALTVLLVLGTLPQMVLAAGEVSPIGASGEITAFEPLEDSVKKQTVPTSTSLEELNLPDTLSATVADAPAEVTAAGAVDSNQPLSLPKGQPVTEVEATAILESHIQTDAAGALFGIQSTTVTIGLADDLVTFANNINNNTYPANTNAVLTSDINMEGKTWTPIGNFAHRYQGTFNGNNHVILNLTYTTPNSQAGVFGMTTNGAVINNLGVTGIFSGNEYIGGS